MFLCRAWRQAMQPGATHRESSAEIAATKKLLQRCGVRAETFERLQAELDCLDAKSVRRCRHCPGGLTVDLPPPGPTRNETPFPLIAMRRSNSASSVFARGGRAA